MTLDNVVPFLIVAVVIVTSLASAARGAKRGYDKLVEQQRAAAAPYTVAARPAAPRAQGSAPGARQGRARSAAFAPPAAAVQPASSVMRRTLAEAFGDPAHARTAVILAEVLAKPVALR